jgi:hypothetical protein
VSKPKEYKAENITDGKKTITESNKTIKVIDDSPED